MSKIQALTAREVPDSRGKPTIEVHLAFRGALGTDDVPSGASVGGHEDKAIDAGAAVAAVNGEISAALVGKEFNQQSLDDFLIQLDGTPDKSVLGANAILGVSIAFARAAAAEQKVELYEYLGSLAGVTKFSIPEPMFNVLNGGKHAHNGLDIQECMLVPVGFATISEKVAVAAACVATLKKILEEKAYGTEMGDEGGFAPAVGGNDEALELLMASITGGGYTTEQIKIALDVAASSIPNLDKERMFDWYLAIAKKYPLLSIEDPFGEDDFDTFADLHEALGERVCIVGDDLTVTNAGRIALAAQKKAVNAVIIKPNQVGSVSETIAAVAAVHAQGWAAIASHRSGETMDPFIADVAVGLGCEYIKAGAPTRPERMVKYDRLIEISKMLS
ncbi:MAG: phosphopyruvate hydratase [Patescibacteria group bacterium]